MRKLPPSHSIMQLTPSRVSWSQVSELWKVPLRSRKFTKAVTLACPSSRKFRIDSARASGVQFSASRRRSSERSTWMLATFCLGWALRWAAS